RGRGALFRSPRLRGRRYLWAVRKADEGRGHHQPPAAGRDDGLRPLARQALDRALAERFPAAAQGTVEVHGEHGQVVRWLSLPPRINVFICRRALSALRLAV